MSADEELTSVGATTRHRWTDDYNEYLATLQRGYEERRRSILKVFQIWDKAIFGGSVDGGYGDIDGPCREKDWTSDGFKDAMAALNEEPQVGVSDNDEQNHAPDHGPPLRRQGRIRLLSHDRVERHPHSPHREERTDSRGSAKLQDRPGRTNLQLRTPRLEDMWSEKHRSPRVPRPMPTTPLAHNTATYRGPSPSQASTSASASSRLPKRKGQKSPVEDRGGKKRRTGERERDSSDRGLDEREVDGAASSDE